MLISFHSINVPSEWGQGGVRLEAENYSSRVSIQLMSPASGDFDNGALQVTEVEVSIQLMSPASGDMLKVYIKAMIYHCFHSINVPSEWGLTSYILSQGITEISFHSINVPSEWGLLSLKRV